MKLVVCLAVVVAVASASSLQFVSVPQSIRLPAPSSDAIKTSSLSAINSNLLGLSAKGANGFAIESDLFSRPRALALILVQGIDQLTTEGDKYALQNDNLDFSSLDQELAMIFGADRESVVVSRAGISGSGLAQLASKQKVDGSVIKTKNADLRAELENIYALAAAIKEQGAKFASSETADICRINILGVSGLNMSDDDKATALDDINNAVKQLTSALADVYGDQAVVEVIAVSSAVVTKNAPLAGEHNIKKRDVVPKTTEEGYLKQYRYRFNVSVFTSSDYPAIFAIFAGLVIALVLAVVYTTVGMMTMDPGKDSIIYRMTTTRMKKD